MWNQCNSMKRSLLTLVFYFWYKPQPSLMWRLVFCFFFFVQRGNHTVWLCVDRTVPERGSTRADQIVSEDFETRAGLSRGCSGLTGTALPVSVGLAAMPTSLYFRVCTICLESRAERLARCGRENRNSGHVYMHRRLCLLSEPPWFYLNWMKNVLTVFLLFFPLSELIWRT